MHFHSKMAWPPAPYYVTSCNHSNWPSPAITKLVSKCTRGINEQLLKTSGADVLSSRKKNQKNLRGAVATTRPPLVRPRVKKNWTSQLSTVIMMCPTTVFLALKLTSDINKSCLLHVRPRVDAPKPSTSKTVSSPRAIAGPPSSSSPIPERESQARASHPVGQLPLRRSSRKRVPHQILDLYPRFYVNYEQWTMTV